MQEYEGVLRAAINRVRWRRIETVTNSRRRSVGRLVDRWVIVDSLSRRYVMAKQFASKQLRLPLGRNSIHFTQQSRFDK